AARNAVKTGGTAWTIVSKCHQPGRLRLPHLQLGNTRSSESADCPQVTARTRGLVPDRTPRARQAVSRSLGGTTGPLPRERPPVPRPRHRLMQALWGPHDIHAAGQPAGGRPSYGFGRTPLNCEAPTPRAPGSTDRRLKSGRPDW